MTQESLHVGSLCTIAIVNDTSWKDHTLMIVAKVNRLLGFIRRGCVEIVGSVSLLRL